MIDVNTSLGRWPFQKFDLDSPRALAGHLRSAGITRALVFSLDAVLYPDPSVCDAELFEAVKTAPMLIPVPTVNPTLSNWDEALSARGLKAVRIVPNYHDYPLDSPPAKRLMEAVADMGIPLLIQMRVDDERNQYPLMKVPGVAVGAVAQLANACPEIPVVCLCAYRGEALELVQEAANVSVDISFVSAFRTLPWLLESVPAERVLFGSHTPIFYTEPAVRKLEAIRSDAKPYAAIAGENAARLFGISTLPRT